MLIVSLLFILLLCFLVLGIYFFQEKVIFRPQKRLSKNYQFNFNQKYEEVNLSTKDNKTINALHFKVTNSKGVILFFHGNKGNLSRWGQIMAYFAQFKYDVFVMDYRGYGKSTGSYNEQKMYDDALLCYDYLKEDYNENQIVVYGRSLGATFAAKVAANNKPKEVVLEAPFYNLKEAVAFYAIPLPSFLIKYKFQTNKDVKSITSPTTIFHGTEDDITSIEGSKKLFNLLETEKEYVTITNGTHHNLRDFTIYHSKLNSILN